MVKSGADKPELIELPPVRDRISFLYLERCIISRKDSSITIIDERGTVHMPASALAVVMLGPGTQISHRAVELIGDAGVSIIWVGENGVRYYAHGRPLTHSSRLLTAQAALVSNTRTRLAVARTMYGMRFPSEDVSALTMQQLRGREGARIRAVYRAASKRTGVPWNGREYDPEDFAKSDLVNMALSAAHACLYGAAHSVITALGCSPGLGFVHTGHERSFVYDIADLYKAEITIPLAFEAAVDTDASEIGSVVRRAVRDAMAGGHTLERMAKDIRALLLDDHTEIDVYADKVDLWDDKLGLVKNAISYGKELDRLAPNGDTAEDTQGYGQLIADDEP